MATAQQTPTMINGVAVEDLANTIDTVKATPSVAKFKFRIRNRWANGSRNHSIAQNVHRRQSRAVAPQALRAGG